MEESVIKSLDSISNFFNLYVVTLSSYGLLGLIRLLNSKFYGEKSPIKFLDMNIYPEYFSLIFGILFFVFILVLHLMFLNLKTLIDQILLSSDGIDLIEKLKYSGWFASPFSKGKSGPIIFASMISLGILYSIFLAIGHIIFPVPKNCKIPTIFYKLIGCFDLIVFSLSVYWFYQWRSYISVIRAKIGA